MKNNHNIHDRQSIRLRGYDYYNPGLYFVTLVSHQHMNIFGAIRHEIMNLNQIGKIVKNTWHEITNHFPYVTINACVIMPNHIHGILQIKSVGARKKVSRQRRQASPLHSSSPKEIRQPLGMIVGTFKSAASKHIHRAGYLTGKTIWQRNYYEHIIRDDEDYQRVIEYIEMNPINWELDNENANNWNKDHR